MGAGEGLITTVQYQQPPIAGKPALVAAVGAQFARAVAVATGRGWPCGPSFAAPYDRSDEGYLAV